MGKNLEKYTAKKAGKKPIKASAKAAKKSSTIGAKAKKIGVVFVCTGNTCRSPVAERLFKSVVKAKKLTAQFKITSIGLAANTNSPISQHSMAILKKHKISASSHKAKPLTDKLLKTTNYFICMTGGHKAAMHFCSNTYTIAEITNGGDVIDPYQGTIEVYQKMYEHLEYAAEEVLNFILNDIKIKESAGLENLVQEKEQEQQQTQKEQKEDNITNI